MAYTKEIEALRLFNEKAEKLLSSKYVQYLKENNKLTVSYSFTIDEAPVYTRNLPDQDAIDAFVLTFRFFMQDNERMSFRNLDKLYGNPLIVPQANMFEKQRANLNKTLNQNTDATINNETLTNSKILDIFFYGGLAHANVDKKKIFDIWKSNSHLFLFLEFNFCSLLEYILRIINNVYIINKEAIAILEKF